MATTTPNFGWSVPTSSDLVKNGATAIETLGDSIDASLWNSGKGQTGKNLVYNSNFDIWQRGTSFTATGYSADRWYATVGGTATVSQETSIVPTGSTYSAKVLTGAGSSYAQLYQAFEAQDVNDWCGQTITFSAYVRALASFVGTANITIFTNTTANTMTGGTWTLRGTGTITPSSSQFDRVSVSYAVPAGTKGIKVELNFTSAQASGTGLYWAQTQLEIGSLATAYCRASATLQGELAACMRYCEKLDFQASAVITTGQAYSTTQAWSFVNWTVQKRTNATITQTGTIQALQANTATSGTTFAYSNIGINNALMAHSSGSGLVAGNAVLFQASGAASLLITAEL